MITLAVETSCDDTSVSIVRNDGLVLSLLSATKDLDHAPYGGIVPEIASRNHSLILLNLIDQSLKKLNLKIDEIDGFSVTNRPGLIGSLIVGIVTVKTLAQFLNKPFIGVNHLEGHLVAPFLKDDSYAPKFELKDSPFIALAISGGHTSLYKVHEFGKYEVLGTTRDDAAGEAIDKFAKMLGLGFPGGAQVDQLAQAGDPQAFDFPRSLLHEKNYDMSFSGVKSAAQRLIEKMSNEEIKINLSDLCASYQKAIIDVLLAKLDRAYKQTKISKVIITGGVSANSRLRLEAEKWADRRKIQLMIPPLRYCTDNAAMIGLAGCVRLQNKECSSFDLGPNTQPEPDDFMETK